MVRVAQCWDDGVATDIKLIRILKKYHAKATFNLNPSLMTRTRQQPVWAPAGYSGWSHKGFFGGHVGLDELTKIYAGFQVASHCLHHMNAGDVPDGEFMKDAVGAKEFLENLFQKECPGFAWPCGKYTPSTAAAMKKAGFAYGRTVENSDFPEKFDDPMILRSTCHYQDYQFISKFKAAKARNGVFYFWGHSYEMMDSRGMWNQLEAKIKYLSEDPEVEWIDVVDIVR